MERRGRYAPLSHKYTHTHTVLSAVEEAEDRAGEVEEEGQEEQDQGGAVPQAVQADAVGLYMYRYVCGGRERTRVVDLSWQSSTLLSLV